MEAFFVMIQGNGEEKSAALPKQMTGESDAEDQRCGQGGQAHADSRCRRALLCANGLLCYHDRGCGQRNGPLARGALPLFPSKEVLYLAISERWNCGMEAAIKARLTPDLTPAAILRVLIEVNGEQVKKEADACRVLMEG